jgi:hypothetical protein
MEQAGAEAKGLLSGTGGEYLSAIALEGEKFAGPH